MKEQQVFQYGENTYFGELALLKDQPRAANVIATVLLSP
jgi:CRP-like cAMP-binding protein